DDRALPNAGRARDDDEQRVGEGEPLLAVTGLALLGAGHRSSLLGSIVAPDFTEDPTPSGRPLAWIPVAARELVRSSGSSLQARSSRPSRGRRRPIRDARRNCRWSSPGPMPPPYRRSP